MEEMSLFENPDIPGRKIPDEASKRADFLRRELNRHTRLYYVDAAPEISDLEFDRMMAELKALEDRYPELAVPDSPARRVGGEHLPGFRPFHHFVPMQSLDNTYSINGISDFDAAVRSLSGLDSVEYVVEPKVDGLAFALHYANGVLISAATRGDGRTGDDVTANIRTIRSIPLRIDTAAPWLEVRGEVYMSKKRFLEIVSEQEANGEDAFKNPRNAAAGSLKLLDPKAVSERGLEAVLYGTGRIDGNTENIATHAAMISRLSELGFAIQPKYWVCRGISEVIDSIGRLGAMRHEFPFETDGAVIKVNDRGLYPILGATAKAPRWARAYKYAPEQAETVLEAITIQVGRTGVLTPVAELRTVRLAGSDISRATLHNADDIARKGIRIGDHVMIEKAGEVIPAVVSVVKEKRTGSESEFVMPKTCPICGEPVVRREGEVAVRCVNLLCPAQILARLIHFASRDALNISGLGYKVAAAIVEHEGIDSPLDIFGFSEERLASIPMTSRAAVYENTSELTGLSEEGDSCGEKLRSLGAANAHTIFSAIEASRGLPLARWIFAIGIPGVGASIARDVASYFENFEEFATSSVIPDLAQMYDLLEETERINPNSRRNRTMTAANLNAYAKRYESASSELKILVSKLTGNGFVSDSGTATKSKYTSKIKPEAARSIAKFLKSEQGREFVAEMRRLGINPASDVIFANGGLSGKVFVFTGTLSGMGRSEAAEAVAAAGGKTSESVSSATSFVVTGENPGKTKITRAQELEIPVIGEKEFLKLLGDTPEKMDPLTRENIGPGLF